MKIYQVDAFTDKPFKGNPAAVCILDSEPQVKWMQDVANEMNLAETAFLVPKTMAIAYVGLHLNRKLICAGMQHWQVPIYYGKKGI